MKSHLFVHAIVLHLATYIVAISAEIDWNTLYYTIILKNSYSRSEWNDHKMDRTYQESRNWFDDAKYYLLTHTRMKTYQLPIDRFKKGRITAPRTDLRL